MFKKIISTICASVFAFSCFGFNVSSEEIINLSYPVKVSWKATSNTDGTDPITGQLDANIIISDDRHSIKLIVSEDFQAWFPIKITNTLDDFIHGKYEISGRTTGMKTTGTTYKDGGKTYSYYGIDTGTQSSFIISGIKYKSMVEFNAGSVITSDTAIYELYNPKIEYFMRDTAEITYGTEQEQYIKQLEEENSKLKTEIESYKKLDFDGDGLLTNADAQMILVYYTDSLVGKTTGKVEDYSEYVKQISS